MPPIFKEVKALKFTGLQCDKCGEDHLHGNFDFRFIHVFGYGSPIDGDQVEVALCDICLERLIKEHIPGAKWTTQDEYLQERLDGGPDLPVLS